MADPFNLDRFVEAQEPVFDRVTQELADGRKRTHWMWFVFPQLAGLGHSEMAQRYAIASLDEAAAYLHHVVLGPRLLECTNLVNRIEGRSVHDIFGAPDDLKFHSCMTLFAKVPSAAPQFSTALFRYFNNQPDEGTLRLLKGGAN